MSYELKKDEKLGPGLRRIAREEIEKAITELGSAQNRDPRNAIHNARKHLKKLRALLRLVRDELGRARFKTENAVFRDAGRQISAVRDAEVLVNCLAGFCDRFFKKEWPRTLTELQTVALSKAKETAQAACDAQVPSRLIMTLRAAATRVESWELKTVDGSGACGGVRRVYKRGRSAFRKASCDSSDENLHELRKRTKDLWYQARLLNGIAPELMKEFARELEALSGFLGDDHDLIALRAAFGMLAADERKSLVAMLDSRRRELQLAATDLAGRLYSRKPRDFARRLSAARASLLDTE